MLVRRETIRYQYLERVVQETETYCMPHLYGSLAIGLGWYGGRGGSMVASAGESLPEANASGGGGGLHLWSL